MKTISIASGWAWLRWAMGRERSQDSAELLVCGGVNVQGEIGALRFAFTTHCGYRDTVVWVQVNGEDVINWSWL